MKFPAYKLINFIWRRQKVFISEEELSSSAAATFAVLTTILCQELQYLIANSMRSLEFLSGRNASSFTLFRLFNCFINLNSAIRQNVMHFQQN